MGKTIRFQLTLAAFVFLASSAGFAQSAGEATYKARCLACHGPAGLANSGVGRLLKVKPVTDPDVRNLTEAEMIDAVLNGKGKMQAYKNSLTDAQVREAVSYLRTFIK
jgi:mono/diheme cytochrome c family protein